MAEPISEPPDTSWKTVLDKMYKRQELRDYGRGGRGVARDLENLETQLRATNASEETIALQRAQYFAEREMLADVLQEIVAHPMISTFSKRPHRYAPISL